MANSCIRQGRVSLFPRLVLTCALMILATAPRLLAQENGHSIAWRDSYETAMRESQASQRPVWLQFTGPWCVYCRQMDSQTFTRPEVGALANSSLIPVKIQADQRLDLNQRFGVSALPATILLDPEGRILSRYEGFAEARQFVGLLSSVVPTAANKDPALKDEVALAGYDPVRLVRQGALTAGSPELTVEYDGRIYRFQVEEDKAAFLKSPERFLPCGQGNCLVNQVQRGVKVKGDPRFGVYYKDHLYLCADKAARDQFARDPERYAQADVAEGGLCPHCKSLAGRKVPGATQFSSFYRGFRYLFPDAEHRQAFKAEPEKYLR